MCRDVFEEMRADIGQNVSGAAGSTKEAIVQRADAFKRMKRIICFHSRAAPRQKIRATRRCRHATLYNESWMPCRMCVSLFRLCRTFVHSHGILTSTYVRDGIVSIVSQDEAFKQKWAFPTELWLSPRILCALSW